MSDVRDTRKAGVGIGVGVVSDSLTFKILVLVSVSDVRDIRKIGVGVGFGV